jgi:hypothetical protein
MLFNTPVASVVDFANIPSINARYHRGIKKHTTLVTRVLMKLSVLLKIIFFISLKTTKITLKIQISEVCDL